MDRLEALDYGVKMKTNNGSSLRSQIKITSKRKPKLLFIHNGEAMYPMIKSLKACISDKVDLFDETFESAAARDDIGECICWHLMGFYNKKLPCWFTVHDYRSLSVGRGRRIKDWVKRNFNAVPDLRVSKVEIESVMRFKDDVETVTIDIAASDYIQEYRVRPSSDPEYDYVYVGVISRERGMDRVLRQFSETAPADKRLLLIGRSEDGIAEEFSGVSNVTFSGVMDQREVYKTLPNCGVGLGFFPNHFPHTHQTPTKLLEYCALGMRILCNEQPMNRAIAKAYGIKAQWRPDNYMFNDLPSIEDWEGNFNTPINPLLFSTHYRESGLEAVMDRIINHRYALDCHQ